MQGSTMQGFGGRGGIGLHPWLWAGAAGLLLLPALAMRFYPQAGVAWTALDFVVMGVLLATACGALELGLRRARALAYRAGFALAVVTALLTAWVNLAVGMLGREGDPANALFVAVLAVAALGSARARLRAPGMVRAMAATAMMQLAVAGIAMGMGRFAPVDLVLTACFALPWALAAVLFRKAR